MSSQLDSAPIAPTPATLGALLAARSVAVVGASERSFLGTIVQRNLRRLSWAGSMWQVHPKYEVVDGQPCWPALTALPTAPDVVVCLTGTRAVAAVVAEAEELGVGWVVVPAGGTAEAGEEAERLADFLRAPERRCRVVGPNCMGIVAPPERLAAYIGTVPGALRPGGAALISQSGAVVEAFATQGRRVGWRLLASVGNEAHLSAAELLRELASEGRTRVACLWLEGTGDPAALLSAVAEAIDAGIEVGFVRAGRSPLARQAALTHTGAITGDWELWKQLLERQGAAVLGSLDELHEFAAVAEHPRRPRDGRWWAVTNSGGQGSQLVDELVGAEHVGFPQPSEELVDAFAERFPHAGQPRNPMDLWGLDEWQAAYSDGTALIGTHADGGTLIASIDAAPHQGDFEGELAAGVVGAAVRAVRERPGWGVAHVAPVAAEPHPLLAEALERHECPSVRGAAGLRALAAVTRMRDASARLDDEELEAMGTPPPAGVRLPHDEALALLSGIGIRVPATFVASSPAEAAAAVAESSGAYVVKVLGPAHRAALGGVRLGVPAAGVRAACMELALVPGCIGFELAEHALGDLELCVAASLDAQLGATATVAVGGALAEQAATAASDLAPRNGEEAERLLARLLGPAGPVDGVWRSAVGDVLVRLGRALRSGAAVEIELNPVLVDRASATVTAVDVLAAAPTHDQEGPFSE